MARTSSHSGVAKPYTAWSAVFYLLLVFIAPLAFFGTAHADKESSPQENYGPGTFTKEDMVWSRREREKQWLMHFI